MRSIITTILLSMYLLAIIKPYAPYIEFSINQEYIASELCENKDKPQLNCNGGCQLNKMVKASTENDDNSTSNSSKNKRDSEVRSIENMANIVHIHYPKFSGNINEKFYDYEVFYEIVSIQPVTPPPKYIF